MVTYYNKHIDMNLHYCAPPPSPPTRLIHSFNSGKEVMSHSDLSLSFNFTFLPLLVRCDILIHVLTH